MFNETVNLIFEHRVMNDIIKMSKNMPVENDCSTISNRIIKPKKALKRDDKVEKICVESNGVFVYIRSYLGGETSNEINDKQVRKPLPDVNMKAFIGRIKKRMRESQLKCHLHLNGDEIDYKKNTFSRLNLIE